MASPPFRFKKFELAQEGAAHPLGTDSVLLGAWAEVSRAQKILDIGTGTGILALMLAQRTEQTPDCRIVAIEPHRTSCHCAQRNFEASPWASRLQLVHAPAQTWAPAANPDFDLIVSNPPFFSDLVASPLEPRRHARTAITLTHPELIEAVLQTLAPAGRFCVILPYAEGLRFCELAALRNLYFTKKTAVRTRPGKPVERLLLQFEKQPYGIEQDELPVYAQGEQYSETFRNLTKDFYLLF